MTIYTVGEIDPQAIALLLKERDELRAVLQERDAEIASIKPAQKQNECWCDAMGIAPAFILLLCWLDAE